MDETFEKLFEESEKEWADIERATAEREKKDKKIISIYCAENDKADVIRTIELLQKYQGMSGEDKEIVSQFQKNYPDKLTVPILQSFLDVKDIYRKCLEYRGEEYD